MIITSTPYRISFFGGGTDYPSWYKEHGGSVLSTTIDKYCYISCRRLPPFFEHRIRVAYSKIELCSHYSEIQHAAVRETLRFMNLNDSLEIHHDGDLPARSGIGSSSSFTVGLLHALYALEGKMVTKHRLALESIHIEQDLIKEMVGSQDQVSAAFGGLNHIQFLKQGDFEVQPITLVRERIEELESSLMLFFTGINRTASEVAKSYSHNKDNQTKTLFQMQPMVEQAVQLLMSDTPIHEFGYLLHDAWMLKRQLSPEVSNRELDEIYKEARAAGAAGGKIIGAGGGGFLLLVVPESAQKRVRERLCKKICVPFHFDNKGSQVIFYRADNRDYAEAKLDRERHQITPFKERESSHQDGVQTVAPEGRYA